MKTLSTALIATLLLASTTADAKIIHEERSLYRNILINEQNGERCMRFVVHDRATHNQSCFYLANPRKLVFDYAKMVVASLLVKPEPKHILIVGLGGGTLPAVFHELLPTATITSVEIDPAVVKAAKRFFNYEESEQVQTVTMDARVYLKRALRENRKWDLIILDAFNGDYIPEHLMTQEFLQEVRNALQPGGLVAANTFSTSRLYHHESVTYASVFPQLKMLASSRGNRVLLASMDAFALPGPELAVQEWQPRLEPYGINVKQILALEKAADWDKNAKVLTDQFAPANLLKH